MPLGDEDGRLHGRARRAAGVLRQPAPRETPADRAARDGKAECAQYVGVSHNAKTCPTKPFCARIQFKSKEYHICQAPTAREAARAYDVVASMIPGRKLNFPTTSLAARSSSQRSSGTNAVSSSSESDIRAKIAAIQRGFGPAGAVKYFGVTRKEGIRNPYQAQIRMDGMKKHLGCHRTGDAAARAYDAVARTIRGRKLNFPNASSEAAAALEH
jgi:hypothetical protein